MEPSELFVKLPSIAVSFAKTEPLELFVISPVTVPFSTVRPVLLWLITSPETVVFLTVRLVLPPSCVVVPSLRLEILTISPAISPPSTTTEIEAS